MSLDAEMGILRFYLFGVLMCGIVAVSDVMVSVGSLGMLWEAIMRDR